MKRRSSHTSRGRSARQGSIAIPAAVAHLSSCPCSSVACLLAAPRCVAAIASNVTIAATCRALLCKCSPRRLLRQCPHSPPRCLRHLPPLHRPRCLRRLDQSCPSSSNRRRRAVLPSRLTAPRHHSLSSSRAPTVLILPCSRTWLRLLFTLRPHPFTSNSKPRRRPCMAAASHKCIPRSHRSSNSPTAVPLPSLSPCIKVRSNAHHRW